ncbi:MAG: phosphoenolpyruvate synthase, partial [Muribaculaceae bacterium]|nr:phosphoenolpyruvate synthase [Muribaculaceae bacterium]
KKNPYLPVIIESSEPSNRPEAESLGCVFIDKNSKKLPVDLSAAISKEFSFGDFVMTDPDTGREIRIRSLKDLQYQINDIPASALLHHASSNDISRWLYSRALFPIAEVIKQHRFYSVDEAPAVRKLFFDLIVKYRKMKNRGVVAVYRKDRFDHYSNFARIGQGSLGGKGRGLAFIDQIIKRNPVCDNLHGLAITIPRTVVLCTDIFDEFMAKNSLYPIALSDAPDSEILECFLKAELPHRLTDDLISLLEVIDSPLAIRSSSLLEDSHYQPFAGIYSTYMIPHLSDMKATLAILSDAIKGVYASVFYADSKAYMTATSNIIDQEKMAVIIQEVVGTRVGDAYFPSFSGVGRSLNYYPAGPERAEEGVAEIAVGLGKYIVDGGVSLRFSPAHPAHAMQTSELSTTLRDTQRELYGLDLHAPENFRIDDGFNIVRLKVQDVAQTGALRHMISTFDIRDGMIRDSDRGEGRKLVTFNNILRHESLPLAEAVCFMLTTGQKEMGRPVEIEFAGIISPDGKIKGRIYWLQIRPIADRKDTVDNELMALPDDRLILRSDTALGNGRIEGINTIVYVDTENFSSVQNPAIALEIEQINRRLTESQTPYVLIGPGRWGSSDPFLGIPVKWPQIAGARLIVESSLPGYRIEPSQGTHFFQNLTSFGVGYFTIDTSAGKGYCDMEYLNSFTPILRTEHVRVVQLPEAVTIGLDGRKSRGVVAKPLTSSQQPT